MAGKVVCIKIGYSVTQVVEMDQDTRNLRIRQSFLFETPEQVIDEEGVHVTDEFVEKIKSGMAENGITSTRVIFTIFSNRVANRDITLPLVKEKKIQLEEVSQEIDYLESVLEFTEKAHSVEELRTIRQELTDSGFLRYRKNRNTKEKPSKPSPYAYTLTSGKRVFAGRNNKENDWLTLKKASSTDIWFHTKDIPGSHVIFFTEGQEPSKEELFEAAAIAAWHSKGSSSENVPVDYTRVKYVKKPAGSKPGMVIFTHNKTLYVDPALPGPDHTAEK